jgi:hypothetical protein
MAVAQARHRRMDRSSDLIMGSVEKREVIASANSNKCIEWGERS